jgi:hypothetical protein
MLPRKNLEAYCRQTEYQHNSPIPPSCTAECYKTKTKLHGLSPQAKYTDQLSDRRLSAKLVPTLADRGCRVVGATNPYGR